MEVDNELILDRQIPEKPKEVHGHPNISRLPNDGGSMSPYTEKPLPSDACTKTYCQIIVTQNLLLQKILGSNMCPFCSSDTTVSLFANLKDEQEHRTRYWE